MQVPFRNGEDPEQAVAGEPLPQAVVMESPPATAPLEAELQTLTPGERPTRRACAITLLSRSRRTCRFKRPPDPVRAGSSPPIIFRDVGGPEPAPVYIVGPGDVRRDPVHLLPRDAAVADMREPQAVVAPLHRIRATELPTVPKRTRATESADPTALVLDIYVGPVTSQQKSHHPLIG